MKNIEIIQGTIESVIFKNDENGYAVCRLLCDGVKDSIICVGNIADVTLGETVEVEGCYDEHGKYGSQFKVSNYKKTIPSSKQGMVKYLGSGIITGIGERLAERIVEKFGDETFLVIESDYLKLSTVKGISLVKAKEISIIFAKQKEVREVIMYLSRYDISTNMAIKIHEIYKENTIKIIEKNPYSLIKDIRGIGFMQADGIAQKMGIVSNDVNRVAACIIYTLSDVTMSGHTFLPRADVVEIVTNTLMVDSNLIDNALMNLHIKREIYTDTIYGEKVVYLEWLYAAECVVASKIKELSGEEKGIDEKAIDKKIEVLEKSKNIKLAHKQKQAIHEVVKNKVTVITGGPGTGKTTLINFVIDILHEGNKVVVLTAPTGRAAKRMTEATGIDSQTIHRLLEVKVIDEDREYQKFQRCETNPIEADVVIVDEVSMLDIYIASSLLRAVMGGSKVIFVGDHNQLPPVGPGNFLKDLINSGAVPVVELKEIFRQSQDSHIAIYARDVNEGNHLCITEKSTDFFFVKRNTSDGVIQMMKELIEKRLPSHLGCETKDIQILTPMKKGYLGTENLNMVFQDVANPKDKDKKEKEFLKKKFRAGDEVMQIKNNYKLEWEKFGNEGKVIKGEGVFNGEQGEILDINEDGSVKILFDDNKIADYSGMSMDEIELSYAMTIHKSQGSEYPVVIIPLLSGPDVLFTRNLLYTAITRAKRMLVIVGSIEAMNRMIDNNKIENRNSGLCERLGR
ncbi:MAG TPA: ATP-dependent RecD-like DNA helicase [Clostridiales bacterium]|nr:MAG: hypothetical protein A2Y18_06430 [Clostridiales bacterium GWD2_32_19]HCC07945.1 ATP-dependent RecD-like DNA helicase [Clostridiales bacterium]